MRFSDHEIRAQVRKIADSQEVAKFKKVVALLLYSMEQTLANRLDNLKESLIALHVFGIADLQPEDTTVRTAAWRARERLQVHYATVGQLDNIRVDMPKGHYFLEFSTNTLPIMSQSLVARPTPWGANSILIAEGETVKLEAFARILIAFCEWKGLSKEERSRRFAEWLSHSPQDSGWVRIAQWSGIGGQFDELLRSNPGFPVSLAEMRSLCQTFDIHPLMLDPLLSEETIKSPLTMRLEHDFIAVGSPSDPFYGVGSQYAVPKAKLVGTDSAFVRLTLSPSGESDTHEHPGDELMFVLDGSITVEFHNTGMHATLRQGDFIHFYSEQTHSARNNSSGDSRMFVIRFYELGANGARDKLRQEVRDLRKRPMRRGGWGHAVSDLAKAWLYQTADLPSEVVTKPDRVHDCAGLGRLLKDLRRDLDHVSHKTGLPSSFFNELEAGRAEVSRPLLKRIAVAYDVAPVLLAGFLFPAYANGVIVRAPQDMEQVDPELVGESGATYLVPRKSLAFSDVSVTRVLLGPTGHTPWNRHPGFELVLPISGGALVEFKDSDGAAGKTRQVGSGEYAHYESEKWHCVRNTHSGGTELFVVRFHSTRALSSRIP